MRLPDCIIALIDYYVGQFNILESLPNIAAIRRLVRKSNLEVFQEYSYANVTLGHPIVIFYDSDSVRTWFGSHVRTRDPTAFLLMVQSVTTCAKVGRSTAALYWLLEHKKLSEHPRFAYVLRSSMLFRFLDVIDM